MWAILWNIWTAYFIAFAAHWTWPATYHASPTKFASCFEAKGCSSKWITTLPDNGALTMCPFRPVASRWPANKCHPFCSQQTCILYHNGWSFLRPRPREWDTTPPLLLPLLANCITNASLWPVTPGRRRSMRGQFVWLLLGGGTREAFNGPQIQNSWLIPPWADWLQHVVYGNKLL